MTDEPKLLPCPFCGVTDTIILNGPVEDDWCAVSCDKCHARGPINYTDSHAIAAWNTRATPPGMIRLDAPELLAMVDALREATSQLESVTGADDRPESDSWYVVTDARAAITAWEKLTK